MCMVSNLWLLDACILLTNTKSPTDEIDEEQFCNGMQLNSVILLSILKINSNLSYFDAKFLKESYVSQVNT